MSSGEMTWRRSSWTSPELNPLAGSGAFWLSFGPLPAANPARVCVVSGRVSDGVVVVVVVRERLADCNGFLVLLLTLRALVWSGLRVVVVDSVGAVALALWADLDARSIVLKCGKYGGVVDYGVYGATK